MSEFDDKQLTAARVKAWHQTGVDGAMITIEAAREWLNACGLLLYAPRPQMADAPAPTFVEATLGAATGAPTMVETEVARSLVARLVSDGSAVPLNLLGVPGDAPDFVVSAQAFSYVFTMRGDKAWKQPPATAGAVKVSPLGLRVYEVLTERGALTAQDLAQELGREVTETAILRALTELWSQLRVLPLVQLGREVTLWELTSKRFTKAIKAGANAGQPSALSALVSLYLAQVFAATEEEIATFLSPLTARSRVREVLHALMGARQLDTMAIDGKTLLHLPGGMPETVAAEPELDENGEPLPQAAEKAKKIGTGRISSFTSETRTAGEFRGKPAGKTAGAARKSFGEKSAGGSRPASKTAGTKRTFGAKPASKYGPRLDGKTDPERRPFKKAGASDKPTFSKPWDEEKKARPAKAAAPDGFTKFRKPAPEDREPLGPREQAGLPPERRSAPKASKSFDRGRPASDRPRSAYDRAKPALDRAKPSGFAKRPYAAKSAEDGARPYAKKPYSPRTEEGAERETFKPRSYEGRGLAEKKSAGFGGKPSSFGAKRPYTPRSTESGGERPYAKKPYTPRSAEGGERPAFKPRSAEGGEKPSFAKRPYTPRGEAGDKPFGSKTYGNKNFSGGTGFAKRPSAPRSAPRKYDDGGGDAGAPVERTLPKRPHKPRAADADSRPFTKAPWTPNEDSGGAKKRAFKPREGSFDRAGSGARKSFGAKPTGRLGGFKKPFGAGPRKPRSDS